MSKIKATIFIPTYNGEDYLDSILYSIFKQKVDFLYDVLIIDSGSKDKTLSIIKKYLKKHENMKLLEINSCDYGHGKTRNYAAQISKGEIMVYLSHDAIPAHDRWLYEMVKPFELSEKIVGVTGKQIPRRLCPPMLKYEIQSVFNNFGPDFGTTIFYGDDFIKDQGTKDAVSFYSDVNSAARRSYLTGVLPYQDVPYAEDQLFGKDIIEAGYYKVYSGRGSVEHSNDLMLKEYKNRMFDEVIGLRKIGSTVCAPSIKHVLKNIAKDWFRIVNDQQYSFKRKIYWLAVNPLFHIEKWRGVKLAVSTDISDSKMIQKHSLEEMRRNG